VQTVRVAHLSVAIHHERIALEAVTVRAQEGAANALMQRLARYAASSTVNNGAEAATKTIRAALPRKQNRSHGRMCGEARTRWSS
jgi:hypothetical protein